MTAAAGREAKGSGLFQRNLPNSAAGQAGAAGSGMVAIGGAAANRIVHDQIPIVGKSDECERVEQYEAEQQSQKALFYQIITTSQCHSIAQRDRQGKEMCNSTWGWL